MNRFHFYVLADIITATKIVLGALLAVTALACRPSTELISETSQNNQASSLPLAESLAPGYPTVKITAPPQEAFVKGSVTVTTEASDNGSIYSVAFYLDQAKNREAVRTVFKLVGQPQR